MKHEVFELETRPSTRPARFAQLVKEELTGLVPGSLRDPRLQDIGWITITTVEITPDLRNCKIFFTVGLEDEPKAEMVESILNQASGFLRRELMFKLRTKVTPQLHFKYDFGTLNSVHMGSLLNSITQKS
jgi:ribosome-binding factor A